MLITCRLASIIEEASEEVRFAEGSPLEGDGFDESPAFGRKKSVER
jgi:hypothetical protein